MFDHFFKKKIIAAIFFVFSCVFKYFRKFGDNELLYIVHLSHEHMIITSASSNHAHPPNTFIFFDQTFFGWKN